MSKQHKTKDWLGENAIAVRDSEGTGDTRGKYADRAKIKGGDAASSKVRSIMMQGNQVQLLFCYLVQQYTLSAAYYHDAISLSNIQLFNIIIPSHLSFQS